MSRARRHLPVLTDEDIGLDLELEDSDTGLVLEPDAKPALTLLDFLLTPPHERPLFVVSDGIGVDSTAMLVGLWRFGLRPDVILHADVGDEHPQTIAYRAYRRRWLKKIGFPDLTIVRRPPSVSKKTQLPFATIGEKCVAYETLPGLAFGGHSCSEEWKIRPQEQWLKRYPPARATWARGRRVVKAIGYDAGPKDARRHLSLTSDEDYDYVYPLLEWGWDRARAVAEIRAAGLRVPRKSSCFFCPASKPWEIAEIVADWPALADRIIEIEDTARPHLRNSDGLWRKPVQGKRGAIARPGSMADFIRALRADRELLRRYLAMAPEEPVVLGPEIGGVPQFRAAPPKSARRPVRARSSRRQNAA